MRTANGGQQSGIAPGVTTAAPMRQGKGGGRRATPHERRIPAAVPAADDSQVLASHATTVHLGPGLHVVEVAPLGEPLGMLEGLELPAAYVAPLPGEDSAGASIVANSADSGPWLPLEGGVIVVRSPPEGSDLLVTVYAPGDVECPSPEVSARRLDHDRTIERAVEPMVVRPPAPLAVPLEVVLHIHRIGDRRFTGEGWFGARGQRLHIEAFSIRPLESLAASDVEFMGFGPGNRQTPWVSDGRLCGTRGRALPLTGFAVRLAPQAQARFDVAYEGAFVESGVVGPRHDGEACVSPIADDPLEAISIRISERSQGSD